MCLWEAPAPLWAEIWSMAIVLDHLGHADWSGSLIGTIERLIARHETRTVDLGGIATTEQAGHAVIDDLASALDASSRAG